MADNIHCLMVYYTQVNHINQTSSYQGDTFVYDKLSKEIKINRPFFR